MSLASVSDEMSTHISMNETDSLNLTSTLLPPGDIEAALLQRWNLPEFMCPFCPFVQYVSVNVSVFTLTAIAIDRHRAILNPLRARPTKFTSKIIICFIWIISIVFATPIAYALRVINVDTYISYNNNNTLMTISKTFCDVVNLSFDHMKTYRYYLVVVQYFIPFCVINFVYVKMAIRLWGSKTPGNAQDSRDMNFLRNKKRVIKMLIIVVALFGFCWLPLQLYNILQHAHPSINDYKYINIIFFCCDWLAMSNSCYNPFIYAIYNEKFKREFRKRFPFLRYGLGFDNTDYPTSKTVSMYTRASSIRSNYHLPPANNRINLFGSGSATGANTNKHWDLCSPKLLNHHVPASTTPAAAMMATSQSNNSGNKTGDTVSADGDVKLYIPMTVKSCKGHNIDFKMNTKIYYPVN